MPGRPSLHRRRLPHSYHSQVRRYDIKLYPRHHFTETLPNHITINTDDAELVQDFHRRLRKVLRSMENANNPMKQYRREHELTCRDMADKMGTYVQRYSKIELGLITPTPTEQEFINNTFGMEVLDWVMEALTRVPESESVTDNQ